MNRITNVMVSMFLNDRDNNHSFIANQSRPPLSVNLYNPGDTPITIVIQPKERAYLPGMFANEKFAHVKTTVNKDKTFVTFKLPVGGNTPVFNSGKVS